MKPDGRYFDDEDVPAPTKGPGYRKLRKNELARKRDINCGFCPFHKGENADHKGNHRNWKRNRKTRYKGLE